MTTTHTDRLGYTEREWEKVWNAQSRDDGAQTAHCSRFDDEDYCEGCDSTVDYSDGSKYGRCNCDAGAAD